MGVSIGDWYMSSSSSLLLPGTIRVSVAVCTVIPPTIHSHPCSMYYLHTAPQSHRLSVNILIHLSPSRKPGVRHPLPTPRPGNQGQGDLGSEATELAEADESAGQAETSLEEAWRWTELEVPQNRALGGTEAPSFDEVGAEA